VIREKDGHSEAALHKIDLDETSTAPAPLGDFCILAAEKGGPFERCGSMQATLNHPPLPCTLLTIITLFLCILLGSRGSLSSLRRLPPSAKVMCRSLM
jgi:hypothetical protein